MSVQEMIEEARTLSPDEIKQLMKALIDLMPDTDKEPSKHSILELGGLGAEIWAGIDPQEYIRQLRDEWDNRA